MLKFLYTLALFLVTVQAVPPYAFFSAKTEYKVVSASEIDVPAGFEARQIFMMMRHGSRGPTHKFIAGAIPKMIPYQNKFTRKSTLCPEEIQAMQRWEPTFETDGDKSITQKGRDEMRDLAIRVREAFPDLFTREYNPDNYDVLTVPDDRCDHSGRTFIQNIFPDDTIASIPVCDAKDILLMVEPLKDTNGNKNKEMKIKYTNEIKKFKEGKDSAGAVERVAERMGIDPKEINYEIVNVMYEVAAFEWSIDDSSKSPWYSLFSKQDLEIFEYASELFRYYFNGYGDPYNAKLACPVAIRLEERLRNKINGDGPDGTFYFAHSTNVLSLYVMLGIGDGDEPLTASNYNGMENLKWRTSLFASWVANVMVVLYEDDGENHYVAFYFNEKLTSIELKDKPPCTVCLWSDIQDKLTAFINKNECIQFVAKYSKRTA